MHEYEPVILKFERGGSPPPPPHAGGGVGPLFAFMSGGEGVHPPFEAGNMRNEVKNRKNERDAEGGN
ncbi:MAG: hypothetical protein CVV32_08985 [Methanomicrobiales archaeon HGW-Methanomicrobiales-3]|nr:MAG: hypothetical protein CVV32_08985 [Methanomicrobiales archaeon HGW-Methanomicrobiales-3]